MHTLPSIYTFPLASVLQSYAWESLTVEIRLGEVVQNKSRGNTRKDQKTRGEERGSVPQQFLAPVGTSMEKRFRRSSRERLRGTL